MFKCDLCLKTSQNEAFVGAVNNNSIFSCFNCFLKSLEAFEFDGEMIFYPLFGTREIQINDKVVFFDKDGRELSKVFLNGYEEGLLSFIKLEIIEELGMSADDLIMLIEPYDIKLRAEINDLRYLK